jgi:alkanesulfonate monooxygenase SsuD/methylene tetrahydromethanopterin reductase-like flavin-dependent oxidoreductase (luciferase family)
VGERLLAPLHPKAPYPIGDGTRPAQFRSALDPLAALTFVAGHTARVALGTSVLVLPLHNPILLARQLTTLDVLSKGRLRVGLGVGWNIDEMEERDHVEALSSALAAYGKGVRRAIDQTDELDDKDTADIFTEISRGVDKYLWLVEAHLGSPAVSTRRNPY